MEGIIFRITCEMYRQKMLLDSIVLKFYHIVLFCMFLLWL